MFYAELLGRGKGLVAFVILAHRSEAPATQDYVSVTGPDKQRL
jgi:hypothetical protein